MAANVSHKLKNAFEGALAGGGDPATSPLYVFGPFLKMLAVAGVGMVTFGTSIWMVVITIAVVSAMYRLVMKWVTDGSGGSGLSEEEFGSWAVKVNAAITFVEYTLTFLVSMAAMVTFIADRVPMLNEHIFGIQYRTFVAIGLSLVTGWLVNRGPKVAARAFGPATAGVLLLLWAMVIATIIKFGIQLPEINFEAFKGENLEMTIKGFASILAVMTGIEVFANLVAAYDGEPAEKSRKAFNSLIIIMGTTAATMLVVGPAIAKLSNPLDTEVSVFTQTMDQLLPAPLPMIGTLVGILVLMSASAASAQGLQNLALGLRERRYIPPAFGQRNQYDVADKPVLLEVAIVIIAFLIFGTEEETYLAIYAAGVFILLSMTGWAVTKRLVREIREEFNVGKLLLIFGTILAALLTTGSTIIIFSERFLEGAWTYFLFIPVLFAIFTYFRNRLGEPTAEMDYLGQLDAAQLAGFGFGQGAVALKAGTNGNGKPAEVSWQPDPIELSKWRGERVSIKKVAVLLDGSNYADQALPMAEMVCKTTGAFLVLLSSVKDKTQQQRDDFEQVKQERTLHLAKVSAGLQSKGIAVKSVIKAGGISYSTNELVREEGIDLVITTTRGKSGSKHWERHGVSHKLVRTIEVPVLLVQKPTEADFALPAMENILVALDGSINSEHVLPYARGFAEAFNSKLTLLTVPEVPDNKKYRAASDVLASIRNKAVTNMNNFLDAVASSLKDDGLNIEIVAKGSRASTTIIEESEQRPTDMIMLTSRGRGGLDLLYMGSAAERVVQNSHLPIFIIPIHHIFKKEKELERAIE